MTGGSLSASQGANPTPGQGASSREEPSSDLLRGVLRRHADAALTGAELRAALRPVVREAHTRHLPVEQLLVELKSAWGALPEVKHAESRREQAHQLERAVSLCIEIFYEP